jgi:hypothetical protein
MRSATKPAFLITIDTEGDNLWARKSEVTTENARHLPRFQELCEAYGVKATYFTDYEMAVDPAYVAFASEAIDRGYAEVGMHLHAWHSPPFDQALTSDDDRHHPYLIEFPDDQMRAKISAMTKILTDAFGVAPTSHRAGRWAFDGRYAAILAEQGYLADCSVTPFTTWSCFKGDPARNGGSDYRFAPTGPYFMDPADVAKPGSGPLLQIPMTVLPRFATTQRLCPHHLLANRWGQRAANQILPNVWLRPSPRRPADMMLAARRCLEEDHPYAMFMTHSSELMPGGSPYFPNEASLEENYRRIEELFRFVAEHFEAKTVTDYARDIIAAERAIAA